VEGQGYVDTVYGGLWHASADISGGIAAGKTADFTDFTMMFLLWTFHSVAARFEW
jgi:hypothetical protein